MLYFAYGSNLLKRRLQERTPAVRLVGKAVLYGHALRFHKRGDDGSGKCDAFYTGRQIDRIHGVLYSLGPGERQILDDIEGVGCGYEISNVDVHTGSPTKAFTYVAQKHYIDHAMEPFGWYRNFVLAGALEHQFPNPYVQKIREVVFKEDPNHVRRAQNDAVIERAAIGLDPLSLRNGGSTEL